MDSIEYFYICIYNNEIGNLILELNKKYKQNINIKDVIIGSNGTSYNCLSGYYPLNDKKHYYIINYLLVTDLYNKLYKKYFKSIEDLIKDYAAHEVIHMYDRLVNKSSFTGTHFGWFEDNYKPLRKRYTDLPFIIEVVDNIEYPTI